MSYRITTHVFDKGSQESRIASDKSMEFFVNFASFVGTSFDWFRRQIIAGEIESAQILCETPSEVHEIHVFVNRHGEIEIKEFRHSGISL